MLCWFRQSLRIDQMKTGRTCRKRRLTRVLRKAMGNYIRNIFSQDKGYKMARWRHSLYNGTTCWSFKCSLVNRDSRLYEGICTLDLPFGRTLKREIGLTERPTAERGPGGGPTDSNSKLLLNLTLTLATTRLISTGTLPPRSTTSRGYFRESTHSPGSTR